MYLDDKQKKILGLRQSTTIIAGAGAGKTTSLVAAVLDDLLAGDKLEPERLAIITFTRAAAANLKSKLISELSKRNLTASPQEIVAKLSIGTIDAVFARLLREIELHPDYLAYQAHHSRSPIPPQVASEVVLKELGDTVTQQVLTSYEDSKLESSFWSVSNDLSSVFTDIYQRELLLNARKSVQATNLSEALEVKPCLLRFSDLLALNEPLNKPEKKDIIVSQQKTAEQHLLCEYNNIFPAVGKNYSLKKMAEKIIAENMANLSKTRASAYQAKILYPLGESLLPTTNLLADLLPVTAAFNRYVTGLKINTRSQQLMDKYMVWKKVYSDKLKTANLTSFTGILVRLAEVSFLTANRYQKLYLDEAQDTSPLQFEIIDRLTEQLVLIGDPNQSIYSFRKADLNNYLAFSKNFPEIILNNNYRSAAEILAFVDYLFQNNPATSGTLPGISKFPAMIAKQNALGKITLCGTTVEAQRTNSSELEADIAAIKIKDDVATGKATYQDYAILLKTNKDIDVYERVLEKYKIPLVSFTDKQLLNHEEAVDLINYLEFIYNPNKVKALIRVLSSPFANFSIPEINQLLQAASNYAESENVNLKNALNNRKLLDDAELQVKVNQFMTAVNNSISLLDSSSVENIVTQALDAHSYLERLTVLGNVDNKLLRIQKVTDYLQELENQFGRNRFKILQALKHGVSSKEEALKDLNAVKIMTIHKAKGDEFPRVIVDASLSSQVRLQQIEGDDQLFIPSIDKMNAAHYFPFLLDYKQELRQEKEKENNRLLYVAMTRAEQELIIINSLVSKNVDFTNPVALDAHAFKNSDLDFLYAGATIDDGKATKVNKQGVEIEENKEEEATKDSKQGVKEDTIQEATKDSKQGYTIDFLYYSPELLQQTGEALQEKVTLSLTNSNKAKQITPPLQPKLAKKTINHSQLYAWKQCSLRKQLEYDFNLTPLKRSRAKSADSHGGGSALVFGQEFHLYLSQLSEYANQQKISFAEALTDAKKETKYSAYLQQMLADQELLDLLKQPAIAEERLMYKINDYNIVGIIDYLLATKQGRSVFLDWKTGDWDNISQVSQAKLEEHAFQRKLYAYGVFGISDQINEVVARSYYLSAAALDYQQTVFNRQELTALRDELSQFIEQVLTTPAQDPELKEENFFCSGCPGLTRICQLSQR